MHKTDGIPEYPKVTIPDVLSEYFRVARLYWKGLIVSFVTTVIPVIATGIIVPIIYKQFFDTLSWGTSSPDVIRILIQLVVIVLILNFIGWVSFRIFTFVMSRLQAETMGKLRQNAYEHVIRHSYTFFSNTFAGSLVQKINRFMRAYSRVSDRFFGELIPLGVKLFGICIVLWYTGPIFSIALIVWTLIFIGMSFFFSRWKIPYNIKAAAVESRASAALADSLSNHTTIQLFDNFFHEEKLFCGVNKEHQDATLKKWNVGNTVDAAQAFINVCLEFVIFYVAIKFWGTGAITIGTFVLIQIYIIGLMHNFWSFGYILRDLYESFADAKEMVEIIKLGHGVKDEANAQKLQVFAGAVELSNVQFRFHEGQSVLNGINLKINAGERIALIGPSGAGKSTFVRLLLRLYDIDDGMICVDGQNIRRVTQSSLRESISFVPQDPILFHRTLKENIKYGKTNASDEEIIHAAKMAHCHEFISTLPHGYDTYVGERGIKLSGGERQRVAIARAILKNAPILILDEATSSLDSQSEVLIQEALEALMKNKTVIVIAHRLSTIRKMNRIIVLDKGNIIEEGTHDLLLTRNGMYAKLWSLQSHGFIA